MINIIVKITLILIQTDQKGGLKANEEKTRYISNTIIITAIAVA